MIASSFIVSCQLPQITHIHAQLCSSSSRLMPCHAITDCQLCSLPDLQHDECRSMNINQVGVSSEQDGWAKYWINLSAFATSQGNTDGELHLTKSDIGLANMVQLYSIHHRSGSKVVHLACMIGFCSLLVSLHNLQYSDQQHAIGTA